MPLVTVNMYEGRTLEQKKALVKGITEAINKAIGSPPEAVSIIIRDISRDNWANAGKLASEE